MYSSAFILAAGKGTRLFPFSQTISKTMLPLLNKPLLFHSIERFLTAGITNIGVVIKKNDHLIPSEVNKAFPDLNVKFIVQEKALGTAHAVLQVEEYLTTQNFLIIAGDSLFPASYLTRLNEVHRKEQNDITLSLERMDFDLMRESSTVDYRNGRVLEVREKPQTPAEVLSDLNSAALYVFSKSIFNLLRDIEKSDRGEYELAPVINKIIRQGYRVGGLIAKRVCHITTSHDLWHYNLHLLHETREEKVCGNIIGENVYIGESALIYDSIIGDNTVIKKGVVLKNCVVLPKTIVSQNFENSLINSDHFEYFSDKKINQSSQ